MKNGCTDGRGISQCSRGWGAQIYPFVFFLTLFCTLYYFPSAQVASGPPLHPSTCLRHNDSAQNTAVQGYIHTSEPGKQNPIYMYSTRGELLTALVLASRGFQ